jgi:hypothetical protein
MFPYYEMLDFKDKLLIFFNEVSRLTGEMGETETARAGEPSRVILDLEIELVPIRPHVQP